MFPNETVKDKSILALNGREIEFAHTPGHTPDSIVVLLKDERIMVAGDTVMELPFLWYGDSQSTCNSLERIKRSISGDTKIVQGHDGICGVGKLDRDINYIENATKLIGEYCGAGKKLEDASSAILLSDCISKGEANNIPEAYKEPHAVNLEKLWKELSAKKA